MKKTTGFTLVELLVVIGIIGILAGILIPVTNIARRKVREMSTRGEIQALSTACEHFKADTGQYPPDYYASDTGGVRPLFGNLKWQAGINPKAVSSRETLQTNDSTKGLVFFLGTRWLIRGKAYGPYMSFSNMNRLYWSQDTSDSVRNYGGDLWYLWRDCSMTGVRGPGDPESDVIFLRCLKDFFDTCYVYDCHDPEGTQIQEEALSARAHNVNSFDLWSMGYDRSPFMPGAEKGGSEPDRGLARTQQEEVQSNRFGNDLVNWHY